MKKLSEIGHTFERASSELCGAGHIILTPDERRELVREALWTFCKDWIYPEDAWKEVHGAALTQITAMLKEQGL